MEGNIYEYFGMSLFEFLGLITILIVISYFLGYCSTIARLYHEEKALKKKQVAGIHRIK